MSVTDPTCPWEDDPAYIAHLEEMEAEHEALMALPRVKGCSAVELDGTCEGCSQPHAVLYGRDCYTLGWEGHPGAEITVFHLCSDCLTK